MVSIPLRTWSAVSRTTIQLWVSGVVGIGASTSGLLGLFFLPALRPSINLITIRYIYVPVGGSKNVIPATLLVFTFVALWHDLSFKLLAWGWLVSLFLVPEILARKLFAADKVCRVSMSWGGRLTIVTKVWNASSVSSCLRRRRRGQHSTYDDSQPCWFCFRSRGDKAPFARTYINNIRCVLII